MPVGQDAMSSIVSMSPTNPDLGGTSPNYLDGPLFASFTRVRQRRSRSLILHFLVDIQQRLETSLRNTLFLDASSQTIR
jgi:hypothetical protein